MAKHYLEQVIGRSIAAATSGIMALRSPVAGKLEKVTVYTKNDVASTQVFDVNHGVTAGSATTVFPTSGDRPSITLGNHSGEATPTNPVTVAVGDLFTVDADVVGEAFELATIVLRIDDGIEQGIGVFARPGNSHAADDEMEGTALAPDWTQTNAAALQSYNDKIKSAYYLLFNASGSDVFLQKSYANAGDFSLTLCGSVFLQENYNNLNLGVFDASENNFVSLQAIYNTGAKIRANKNVSGTVTTDVLSTNVTRENYPSFWLKIERSGNNWSMFYSNNGTDFTSLGAAIAVTINVHHVKITCGPGGGATKKVPVVLHWLRFDW